LGLDETVPREAFRVVKLLKLLKLMRVFRLGRLVGKYQERYQIKHATMMIVKFTFIILFAAHWLGCIYFFAARIQTASYGGYSWLTEYLSFTDAAIGERDVGEKYVASLYWALTTMTTIGYGDIIPVTVTERLVTAICMISGACTFAYGLTNVCTLLFNHNKHQVDFEGLNDELNEFLTRHNVSKNLQQRVFGFLWFRHNSSSVEDFDEHIPRLLSHLSPALQDAVYYSIAGHCWDSLHSRGTSPVLAFGAPFRTEVARKLIGQVYPPDEMVRGDTLRDKYYCRSGRIYFVAKGLLCAVRASDEEAQGVSESSDARRIMLNPGSSFGELEVLLGRKWNEDILILGQQHSDVYSIDAEALLTILKMFPVESATLQAVLSSRDHDYIEAEEVLAIEAEITKTFEEIEKQGLPVEEEKPASSERVCCGVDSAVPESSSRGDEDLSSQRGCLGVTSAGGPGCGSGRGALMPDEDDVEVIQAEIIATQEKLLELKDAMAEALAQRQGRSFA